MPLELPVTLKGSVSQADFDLYAKLSQERLLKIIGRERVAILGSVCAIAIIAILFFVWPGRTDFISVVLVAAGMLAGLVVFVGAMLVYQQRMVRQMRRDNAFRVGAMTVVLSDEGIETQMPHGTSFMAWSNLSAFQRVAGLDVVWINTSQGGIIPHSVYADAEARDGTAALCGERINSGANSQENQAQKNQPV